MSNLEDVKKLIRSILVSAPTKVTIQSLARDFRELEGYNIPFKELGYNSLIHLLNSIPDVLRVNGTSSNAEITLIVSEKTAHVSDMVMKQRKPANRKKTPKKRVVNVPRRSIPNTQRNNIPPLLPNYSSNFIQQQTPFYYPNVYIPMFSYPQQQVSIPSIYNNQIPLSPFPRPLPKPNKTPPLPKHPRIEAPKNENVNQVRKLQSELNKLKIQNTETRPSLDVTVSLRSDSTINNKNNDTKIPAIVQVNLRKLIGRYPKGIWCTELATEYKKLNGYDIEFEKYGFLSLVNLCLTLEDIFYCRKESSSDYKLYDKQKSIPKHRSLNKQEFPVEKKINIDPFSIIPVKTLDWDNFSALIPKGVLILGETVKNDIPEELSDTKISVIISEICNPSNFWMYKDDNVLNKMMNSMQDFYSENKANYLIPEILLEIGLYCVVYLLDEFQRGVIVDLIPNTGFVKIYFLDYGTLTNIPRNKIWFLTEEFAQLPCQAIRAELADIEPNNGEWCQDSSAYFKDFVSDKIISAKILKNSDKRLSVHLADTKSPLDFINDLLVKEGFAKYIDKEMPSVDHTTLAERKKGMLNLLQRVKRRTLNCDQNCK